MGNSSSSNSTSAHAAQDRRTPIIRAERKESVTLRINPSGPDCSAYFNGQSCPSGANCNLRHCAAALNSHHTCLSWKNTRCNSSTCPYRHTQEFRILCVRDGACADSKCLYKHDAPRPLASQNPDLFDVIDLLGLLTHFGIQRHWELLNINRITLERFSQMSETQLLTLLPSIPAADLQRLMVAKQKYVSYVDDQKLQLAKYTLQPGQSSSSAVASSRAQPYTSPYQPSLTAYDQSYPALPRTTSPTTYTTYDPSYPSLPRPSSQSSLWGTVPLTDHVIAQQNSSYISRISPVQNVNQNAIYLTARSSPSQNGITSRSTPTPPLIQNHTSRSSPLPMGTQNMFLNTRTPLLTTPQTMRASVQTTSTPRPSTSTGRVTEAEKRPSVSNILGEASGGETIPKQIECHELHPTNLYIKNIHDDVDEERFRSEGQSSGGETVPKQIECHELHPTNLYIKNIHDDGQASGGETVPKQIECHELHPTNLYIKNIHDDVDEERLRREFEQFGNVTSAKVIRFTNGNSKGFGFVNFSREVDANLAMSKMHGCKLHPYPRAITVHHAWRKDRGQNRLGAKLGSGAVAQGRGQQASGGASGGASAGTAAATQPVPKGRTKPQQTGARPKTPSKTTPPRRDSPPPSPADTSSDCSICLNEPAVAVVLPCGHICMCMECAAEIKRQTNLCPMCRKRIESFHKTFRS